MFISEHWIKVTWKNYRCLCSFSLTQRSCQIWTRENQICAVSYNFPREANIISDKRSLQLLRLRSTALSATNTGAYGRLQLLAADAAAVYLHLAVQILCCPGEPYLTLVFFFQIVLEEIFFPSSFSWCQNITDYWYLFAGIWSQQGFDNGGEEHSEKPGTSKIRSFSAINFL